MRTDGDQVVLRLRQAATRAAKAGIPVAGFFLTGAEAARAVHEARDAGVSVAFDGGWPDAERMQCCFYPDWDEPVFTAVWLEIHWPVKFVRCDHRDLLGSLMALGMDRSCFGDLIALEDRAYLCALPTYADRLTEEWTHAGNAPLTLRLLEEAPDITPPEGTLLRTTLASTRLDAVLAGGMKISRARAADMIRQGLVSVDHTPEERIDRLLSPGQLLSIRGFGRIRLREESTPNRKDRLPVTLEIFQKS